MSTSNYRYKIHDKLYDLSEFVNIHPGGKEIFNALTSDTNITPMIYAYHKNPKNILALLPSYEIPTTDLVQIKYNTDYTYDMYCELKELVYNEMKRNNIPFYWSIYETIYNLCMLALYVGLWIYCFAHGKDLSYGWMVLMGVYTTSWALFVFHETSHYTGFKNQTYNLLYSCLMPFTTMTFWKYEHNFLHHSFTDTEYDGDIQLTNSYYIRYVDSIPHSPLHPFQYIYIYFAFIISSLYSKRNYFSINLSNPLAPILIFYFLGIYNLILFYIVFGFQFLFIANLSHIHNECIQINTEHKNDFLYNQVSSSINYRTDDPFTRFICMGLDIQIEHHLFPNIPHSSLRRIQPIVRSFCNRKGIPYIEYPNILHNMYSFIKYLYQMGTVRTNL